MRGLGGGGGWGWGGGGGGADFVDDLIIAYIMLTSAIQVSAILPSVICVYAWYSRTECRCQLTVL